MRKGKLFHGYVQNQWSGIIEGSKVHNEKSTKIGLSKLNGNHFKLGRIDIFIDQIEDFVTIVEIKSTDWDKVRMKRRKLLSTHCRQIFKYIDQYLIDRQINVCAAIIYPRSPADPAIRSEIEDFLHQLGLDVVWFD